MGTRGKRSKNFQPQMHVYSTPYQRSSVHLRTSAADSSCGPTAFPDVGGAIFMIDRRVPEIAEIRLAARQRPKRYFPRRRRESSLRSHDLGVLRAKMRS
jgi:hypothetical protein